jgi:hypothetical protein
MRHDPAFSRLNGKRRYFAFFLVAGFFSVFGLQAIRRPPLKILTTGIVPWFGMACNRENRLRLNL